MEKDSKNTEIQAVQDAKIEKIKEASKPKGEFKFSDIVEVTGTQKHPSASLRGVKFKTHRANYAFLANSGRIERVKELEGSNAKDLL